MSAEVLKRIQQEQKAKTGVLDLSDLEYDSLPDELFELTWLKVLYLRADEYYPIPDELLSAKLPNIPLPTHRNLFFEDLLDADNALDLSRFTQLECLIADEAFSNPKTFNSISQLTELRVLSISPTVINEIGLLDLSQLTELQMLNARGIAITSEQLLLLPDTLEFLRAYRAGLEDISHLAKLTNLICLDLSENVVADITPLSALNTLQSLELSDNELSDISPLSSLSSLIKLDLCGNELSSISPLSELKQLEQLSLRQLDLHDLTPLASLSNLKKLKLWGNYIRDLTPLNSLVKLETLDLAGNAIEDISAISSLINLRKLDLDGNGIADISPLAGLPRLSTLSLSSNSISDITPLSSLTNLSSLNLFDNPFEEEHGLSLELGDNHLPEIKNLLLRLKSTNSEIKLPCKVAFLGNHSAGKSSLIHYLKEGGLDSKTRSTHILEVAHYVLSDESNKQSNAQNQPTLPDAIFYDFGGQDYYHGVYRVFMQHKALTCLLWKDECNQTRQAKDSHGEMTQHFSLDYWLAQWQGLREAEEAKQTPLLLIQTHADSDPRGCLTPEQAKVADNQFYISLDKAGDSVVNQAALHYLQASLNELIEKHKRTAPGDPWYQAFINYILKRQQPGTLDTYTQLGHLVAHYQAGSEDDKAYLKTELTQLHRQGLVLYYPQINDNKVWLDPQAVIRHIHTEILNLSTLKNSGGRVAKSKFERLIKKQKIDTDLIALLKQEKVIFYHDHSDEYIIPNYLPLAEQDPNGYDLLTFGYDQTLAFTLKFARFIPMGLINQLICHFGILPDAKTFWRNQLLFTLGVRQDESGNKDTSQASKVLIKVSYHPEIRVRVYISGPKAQRLRHTAYLYYVIMGLYHDFDITREVAEFEAGFASFCKEKPKLQNVEQIKARMKRRYYEQIFNHPPKDLSISLDNTHFVSATNLANCDTGTKVMAQGTSQLLDSADFQPFTHHHLRRPLKVFISYCHDDMAYKHTLEAHLTNLVRDHSIEIWQDGLIKPGELWDSQIRSAIDKADVVILLVSQAFIASSYVHTVELPKVLDKLSDSQTRLYPVLLSACDIQGWQLWPQDVQSSLLGNQAVNMASYQFFPQDDTQRLVPINQLAHPEQAWTELTTALREEINAQRN
ncbi:leucine-rich repeat domain-containing protein [Pseudoalteromonas sp. R3]|uniref:leucine-rich repeat domain-containing protein n=1 Tax=Pseudoalteromonas sp. R3 TaxID=1709477 RepID=UPI0006B5FC65|nr:leucine-rich repeat domain-containing protein [Pseudoalteromonas sp. R3]AZZ99323.1 TIR domain-containing protein [Pseudoalteromonas sp. R3]